MAEPIDLADAKRQLEVVGSAEDALITDAIVDARGWIEGYTGLILTRRTVTEVLPSFSHRLRAWPITSIDAIAYVDANGQAATLPADSHFDQIALRPASLVAPSWPKIAVGSMVSVTMTAGFATPAAIKEFSPKIMRAMRILVAGFYRDREFIAPEVEKSAKNLCRDFRSIRV